VRHHEHSKRCDVIVRGLADQVVFAEVFLRGAWSTDRLRLGPMIRHRYDTEVAKGRTPLIIDCGANAGYATRYFGLEYPDAHIVAIEPDRGNIAVAEQNCASVSVDFVCGAVASDAGTGRIVNPMAEPYGYRVSRTDDGETTLVTIVDLLSAYDATIYAPFLIKIDIEGGEADLFSSNTSWLDRFPVLMIELHDFMLPGEASSRGFFRELGMCHRDVIISEGSVFAIDTKVVGAGR
jgi:FkbM family methyltransferase